MTNTNYCCLVVCKVSCRMSVFVAAFFFSAVWCVWALQGTHGWFWRPCCLCRTLTSCHCYKKNMVCIQCRTMLWLCHGWRRKTTLAGLNLWASSAPQPPFFFQYKVNHLTSREQQSKLLLQALVTKRNDCSYCQSVLLMYSAPTGLADNRKAGGNSVALCCLRLIYIGNRLSLALSHTLWCDFTVVTLIQAHFDLALSCCSFSLPPAITLCSLVARLCSF